MKRGDVPKSYIKKFLPKGPVILEAGAHTGTDTLEMAEMWPFGTIHAFEPIPHLFSQLRMNTCNINNVKCYPLAISDQTGSSTMYVSSGSDDGSGSLLSPKEHLIEHPDVKFLETIQVSTITLDLWAINCGINCVDFLWLDLQGHELSVLKAARSVLNTIRAIHTEVSLKRMYNGAALYPELWSWLEDHGFKVQCEVLPWADMGNVLFIKT